MVFREIVNANRPGVRPSFGAPKRHPVLRSPPRELHVQAVVQRNALAEEGLLHISPSISTIGDQALVCPWTATGNLALLRGAFQIQKFVHLSICRPGTSRRSRANRRRFDALQPVRLAILRAWETNRRRLTSGLN